MDSANIAIQLCVRWWFVTHPQTVKAPSLLPERGTAEQQPEEHRRHRSASHGSLPRVRDLLPRLPVGQACESVVHGVDACPVTGSLSFGRTALPQPRDVKRTGKEEPEDCSEE